MAIPVTPPSKKPLGSRKAFKPMLARKIANETLSISHVKDSSGLFILFPVYGGTNIP